TLDNMPPMLKDTYLKANPDPKGLQAMFDRDRDRMLNFKDISDERIKAIQSPTLVLNADADVILPESALALSRLLPHAQLAILPGGHGEYIGEICSPDANSPIPALVTAMIVEFLKK
ncbi:MAG TPA: alpha/beta hydrolase, partial [Chitinophaga sp.]|uniref:alpha/beta fold hydrolase n=1 Tax=Chitinophaga sp. TaxID=1869181 RepID=UPI002FAEDF95